ncbi:MAG TPA: alpha/beta fold hydrolase [Accumulibacter sp.]|uniref:alpha/beta fold hydrolase n=1 Tax=Accumulibacter sp. TaxID=2053492 RepID=UPI002C23B801|nr:alpha/beta fold hydrolase [Accumulibacter sp.]HRD89875.1 alpha/beta fold hydrolase [Accumulibacter sp.]
MPGNPITVHDAGGSLKTFRRSTAPLAERAAIVFIHGFGGDWAATWKSFPKYLVDERSLSDWDVHSLGYDSHLRVDVIKLWSADPDLQELADKLVTDATAGELRDYGSLALVAHSMGGLVVQRALLDSQELLDRVSHVFLFGTPSGGLIKASLVRLLKPQLRDMARDGAFIRRLRGEWNRRFTTRPFLFSVVAGLRDEFVPYESSLGPFPEADYRDSRFVVPGNHLEIVKPDSARAENVQLVINRLVGGAAAIGPWNAARVAVESRNFQHAVTLLEPHAKGLDQEGLVQLALGLEGVGRREDAIAVLTRHGGSGTDAMGVLAGRLKRRWLLSRCATDATTARQLYADALARALAASDHAQAYYHAINVAFFQLFADRQRHNAQATARQVLEYCSRAAACELKSDRKWRLATEGEALLHLGDADGALARYEAAIAPEQEAQPREIESMYRQAIYLSREVGDTSLRRALTHLFRNEDPQ